MRAGRACVLALVMTAVLGRLPATAADSDVAQAELAEALRGRIEGFFPERLVAAGEPLRCRETLPRFYVRRAFAPAWFAGAELVAGADSFLAFLPTLEAEGLRPGDYRLDELQRLRSGLAEESGPALRADLDLLLSDAWLLVGSHLLVGRIDPETIDPEWTANRRGADLAAVLDDALREDRVVAALRGLAPPQPRYAALREALAAYRNLSAAGGWPLVPDARKLEQGATGPAVDALRARLAVTDGAASEGPFDDELAAAVRRFQSRHGLDVDGVVGPATLRALNVPVADRILQIEANLERWRWLPQDLGARHLEVNIADQRLELRQDGVSVLDMAVIVGRSYRRTPVFTGQMTYLVFSPAWEVPPRLAVQDKLPDLRTDPQRLVDLGFQALSGWGTDAREIDILGVDWSQVPARGFPYRLRQKPGPQNALGTVKFMFPNKHNVYLHDTPSRELFSKTSRTFSSGCIRVSQPLELAEALLVEQPAWTPEAILAAMTAGEERTVRLVRAVPVHLLYWTAWVASDGVVHFRTDIYGRDRLLEDALAEPAPTPP